MSDDEEYQMPPEQLAVWRSIDDKLKEQDALDLVETDRYIDSFDGLHPAAAHPWTEVGGRVIPTRKQLQQLRERMEEPMQPTRYVISPQQWADWQDQLQPLADAFTVMGQTAWDAASGLLRFAENIDPDTPPTDPRERALWLREHRNTGPHTTPLNQRRRTR